MDGSTRALSLAGLVLALAGTAQAQDFSMPQDDDYFTASGPDGATVQFLFGGPSATTSPTRGTSTGSVQLGTADDLPGFWTMDNETGEITVTIIDPYSLVGTCDRWPDYIVGETLPAASERTCWLPEQFSQYTLTYHGQQ
ncbi:hypothetical protein [uncultured Maricaulis sp.]|uniref:hypothetical protein n=1 Tax=uncultured Maricaulis sp. TaxID=174710 RepID=UPI0026186D6F|nr:hypothetical protein [uncultured Maricaulis sp.]